MSPLFVHRSADPDTTCAKTQDTFYATHAAGWPPLRLPALRYPRLPALPQRRKAVRLTG